MLPSRIFFDNFFDELDAPKKFDKLMKCDIYEKEGNYIIEMDIPGYEKEDINMELENGYLKIQASKKEDSVEDKEKKYVRRERHVVSKCERSFYVGDITEDRVKAKFKNGILEVTVPIEEEKKEEKKKIMIED